MKEFIQWLKRYRENLRHEKANQSESLKILSNTKEWQEFAAFWKANASAIHTVSAVKLLDYIQSNSVSQKEIDAYKTGLAALPLFLESCFVDVEKNIHDNNIVEST